MVGFNANDRSAWFFGVMNREVAVSKLTGKSIGTFLIRKSPRGPGDDYVLSVSETGKIANYKITREHDYYRIGEMTFTDVPQLLEHYSVNYLDTTTLTSPVQRSPPPVRREVRQNMGYVVAKFDFQAQDDEDLPFKRGDILEIIRKQEDKWWTARNSLGKEGSIPVPYVEATNPPQRETIQSAPVSGTSPSTSKSTSRPGSYPDDNRPVYARVVMRRLPNAYDETALPLEVGDIIRVTNRACSGQWEGEIKGRKGHFPFTHVQIVDPNDLSK